MSIQMDLHTIKCGYLKTTVISVLLIFIVQSLSGQQYTNIHGDYFGQTPPGDSAVIFAPGIISLHDRTKCRIVFSPVGDECFFNVWAADYSSAKIYYMKRENDIWLPPVEAPFSIGRMASSPFLSYDGNRLYFHYANYKGPEPYDIWMVRRASDGWSKPEHLASPINSDFRDGSYSETKDGRAYFSSNRPGGLDNKGDIWRTRRLPGQPLQAENLGAAVNSNAWDASPCIAPDESYLMFISERPGGRGHCDLYITYKKDDGSWSVPSNMEVTGAGINLKNTASGDPSLSPDGRFLFFSRSGDIYWVSTKVIDDIKKKVFSVLNR